MNVSVIIPTLNEEKNLPTVLSSLAQQKDIYEIIIIDGHSTDNTLNTAREIVPDIKIIFQSGKGKGDALRAGFKEARGDFVVALDADASMNPNELPRFLKPLYENYDYAKGSRFLPGGGTEDMPAVRKFGNRVFTILVNLLYGTKYTDCCYGYMAFRKTAVLLIDLMSDGFEIETEINIRAGKKKLRVIEVPSFEYRRHSGTGSLHTVKDGWRILKKILGELFTK